ncbi:MAG: hypothetical protein FWD91_04420 [Treponema sp.]|nr:hypothetical protein [Treponema sp.]
MAAEIIIFARVIIRHRRNNPGGVAETPLLAWRMFKGAASSVVENYCPK